MKKCVLPVRREKKNGKARRILSAALPLFLLFCGCAAPRAEGAGEAEALPLPSASLAPVSPGEAAEGRDFVYFLKVGKADAALLRLGEEYYLVDTGSKESYPALSAALKGAGVSALSGVFLSHTHDDHTGGLKQLAAEFPIAGLYCAEISLPNKKGEHKLQNKAEKLELPIRLLRAGERVETASGAVFEVLGPLIEDGEDDNDNSLVLRLLARGANVLFTGDMQFREENSLLAAGVDLKADILKVGNHGNPDATGEAFAAAVSPRVAVISTDRTEDKDSANPRVLEALSMAEIFLTEDRDSGILIYLDGNAEFTIK